MTVYLIHSMTHIGKHELNENESEWLLKYADGVYDRSSKDITAALNKQITAEDVKAFLKETHYAEIHVVDEPEAEPEAEVESEEDEKNID